jgi:hypothetical protein
VHGVLDFADYARRNDDATVSALADLIEVVPDATLDYVDAVVTVDGDRTCRASELPQTLFYRDAAEQRRVAGELLGDRGVAVVDALLTASDDAPADEVLHQALQDFHSHPNRT